MNVNPERGEHLTLDTKSALRLSKASRIVGGIEAIAQLWPLWPEFAHGPLTAMMATTEAELQGYKVRLTDLLALNENLKPTRPNKGMRFAVGVTNYHRRLAKTPLETKISPSMVTEVLYGIDSPHLARSATIDIFETPTRPAAGSSIWTLAPKWIKAGLPSLWVAGLALATWERDGPEHKHRSPTGRLVLSAITERLGLPSHIFALLGMSLDEVACANHGSLNNLTKIVREEGTWRKFVETFLSAAELSGSWVKKTAIEVMNLTNDNAELIETWIRAPRHPKRFLSLLAANPVVDIPFIAKRLKVTQRTAGLLVSKLMDLSLLVEITGQKRGRKYAYAPVMEILQPGWLKAFRGEKS